MEQSAKMQAFLEAKAAKHRERVGDLDVRVALGLAGVDAIEEAESVDTLGEGGAASDGASLDSLLDVGVLLAGLDLDGAGGRSLGDNVESADAGHVFGVCVVANVIEGMAVVLCAVITLFNPSNTGVG